LLVIAVSVLAALFLVGLPIGLEAMVAARTSDNDELSTALTAVQDARAQVREHQAKKDLIAARYAKKAPPLAGYLQQQAVLQKLDVSDSVDNPDIPHGKRYVERSTRIHLKKGGMYAIGKFLESIETNGMPMSVTRLNIHKRPGEPDAYDSEVGVSAYDRVEKPPTPAAAPSGSADDSSAKKTP
jgi:general secretion pathway protein M